MSTTAVMFLLAGNTIAGWFISDAAVITIASQLLIVAGVFQIFDGLQVISAGALRGIGDVRVPALFALFAYWGIALPVGSIFALSLKWGAEGMWIGLAAGLGIAALCLAIRAWRKLSKAPTAA